MAHGQQAPSNIAHAVIIKDQDVFFISERDGSVPAGSSDGFGLYYHDCRYLDGYRLTFADTNPISLLFSAVSGSAAQFELTNEELRLNGSKVRAQQFGCALTRTLDGDRLTVRDEFTIHNFDIEPHDLPISFSFDSKFEDIFEIRGLHPKKIGRECEPEWKTNKLILRYEGADGIERMLEICFQREPSRTTRRGATFDLHLPAGHSIKIALSLRMEERRPAHGARHRPKHARPEARPVQAEITSDWPRLDRVFARSMFDLEMLSGELDGLYYFSAGLPWFGALFGRDSIIAALQVLAFDPDTAGHTLRLLAKHQATEVDEKRDAEPGKILHEFRRGELANLNEIPQTPYYGSVDATPLFLVLLGEHAAWTGDLKVFTDLRCNVEQALAWIDRNCAKHSGYLAYESKAAGGLGNQGWKDSGDAIINADGTLATPPIAPSEVQGYVYKAKLLIGDLYARIGEADTAKRLHQEAVDLKARFNKDFWIASESFYALALQRDRRPAMVVSSNPGQALWSGIIEESRAESVVRALTSQDMFSGWGIRTLSEKEARYNPIGYHLGTVWPHDNALIGTGFKRHRFHREALRVLEGIVEAAGDFPNYRLPEVFAGFSRETYTQPVRYPVACHPQAWASGSIPYLLTNLLGLEPDGFNHKLQVNRPALPPHVNTLEIRSIRVGRSTVDLRFTRTSDDEVEVRRLGTRRNHLK